MPRGTTPRPTRITVRRSVLPIQPCSAPRVRQKQTRCKNQASTPPHRHFIAIWKRQIQFIVWRITIFCVNVIRQVCPKGRSQPQMFAEEMVRACLILVPGYDGEIWQHATVVIEGGDRCVILTIRVPTAIMSFGSTETSPESAASKHAAITPSFSVTTHQPHGHSPAFCATPCSPSSLPRQPTGSHDESRIAC